VKRFSSRVIAWQRQHGRHALPWQTSRDPYAIWLSEIMLQQTQVATVIPYFLRFLTRFPDLSALALASEDEVLVMWSGLGYYSRARNLHKAAQQMVANHGGAFPTEIACLQNLPGVGRSTAAAVAALAFGKTHAILDGNVRRVLTRHAGVSGWPGDKVIETKLWALAEARLPRTDIEAYTQGMMDLGASVCTRSRPTCSMCPVAEDCVGLKLGRVAQLPTPRPKKDLPEKQVRMLILMYGKKLLLEKRPSSGIWGGLWSFPELDLEADPIAYCETEFGLGVSLDHALPVLKHSFTHFRLHISPLLLNLNPKHALAPLAHQRWFPKPDVLQAAVPTPVRKLLMQF